MPELYENNTYKDLTSSCGLEISFLHKNFIKHNLNCDVKLDKKNSILKYFLKEL